MMGNGRDKYDAIIIGSGLSGLLCGNLLAKEGMRVCILEQHHQAGGCLQTFTRKGITFDTGIHYFGGFDPGQPLRRYWEYFGLTDSLELERMDPDGFDIIGFPDNEYPVAMGFENFADRLLPFFPKEKNNLEQYVKALQEIAKSFPLYNLEAPGKQDKHFYKTRSAFEFFKSFDRNPVGTENPSSILHPLSSIFAGNNLLYAGNEQKTPLHIAAIINHSFISSAWRPVNGSSQIATKLVSNLKSQGGELFLRHEVSSITLNDGKFTVFSRSGEKFSSARLISSIHPAKTLGMMDSSLFRKSYFNRVCAMKNTIASFTVNAILKEGSFPYLKHNLYYRSGGNVWTGHDEKDWPEGYMLQTPAPSGENGYARSLVILSSMPCEMVAKWKDTVSGNRGNDYLEFKEMTAGKLLDLAEMRFPGLRSSISFTDVSTPLTWRDHTGIPEGSMYGIERDFNNPLGSDILPRTKIPGLFFTGQNVNLHGVLGVTIGSVLTCGEILGIEYLVNKIRNHE